MSLYTVACSIMAGVHYDHTSDIVGLQIKPLNAVKWSNKC